ncbi:MAG: NAD-dependent epimerase [Alphaproteobacteria bacterium]|nr:NAD-dependent epimerase [Alphaproteobacteria bacterium]
MTILITGAAGFIGYHTAQHFLARGEEVIGFDVLNDYYSVDLKKARLALLEKQPGFKNYVADLANAEDVNRVFAEHKPDIVVNLAAQAGVRYSIENPQAYIQANLVGFGNILEACRHHPVKHLVYASSSSVYGSNGRMPFSVSDNVDHPLSLYAATKKSNELTAHCYSHLYGIPATGLRFFTVYGPWGRPDMALFIFTRKILAGEPIDVFNHGKHRRDFTYIDDIVDGVVRVCDSPVKPNPTWDHDHPDPGTSSAPHRVFNIGNNNPASLMEYIAILEKTLGREAKKNFLPLQPGDVPATAADITAIVDAVGYQPRTGIDQGIPRFVEWYRDYYSL